jgi:hypothetical protein
MPYKTDKVIARIVTSKLGFIPCGKISKIGHQNPIGGCMHLDLF